MADDGIDEFLHGLIRYAEHLPCNRKFPLEVLVLRGHLLIEEELRLIILAKFSDQKAYDLEATKYSSLLRLAKALYGSVLPEWKWHAAKEVNEIRNSIAHRLKDEKIESRLEALFRHFKKNDSTFAHAGQSQLDKLAYCLSAIHTSLLNVRT